MSDLKGKVAVVTGASKGIGAGIAKNLAAAGAAVAVNYASSREDAERVVADIKASGGKAIAVKGDVAKAADVRRLFEETKLAFGRVDILVNNAGIYHFQPLEDITEDEFHLQFNTNVLGTILAAKEAAKHFGPGGGSIINISSVASIRWGGVAYLAYSASKAALNQLTKCVGLEYARRGIRCNCILPGLMDTPMPRVQLMAAFAGTGGVEDMLRVRDAISPTGKQGEPWDVAYAALFLASDESKYVNAAELVVDGGLSQATAGPAKE
jgi:3-oxoacyl-[acyl-carrier protein] reductase